MTAALELSRLGIPLRIIEKTPKPATISRAIGVQARTLELFEQRGIVKPMLEKGNRGLGGSIYGKGKRTFRLEFSHNGSHYGYMLFISQAETEAVLRTGLEKQMSPSNARSNSWRVTIRSWRVGPSHSKAPRRLP